MLALAFLLGMAAAAPLTNTTSQYYCGSTSIQNNTSPGSPSVSDCQTLAAQLAPQGPWNTSSEYTLTLGEYGTCALSVSQFGETQGTIGGKDAAGLIKDSVVFAAGGKVATSGGTVCKGPDGSFEASVDWNLGMS